MSWWDYRIISRKHKGAEYFGIHEVFYDGESVGWTEKPVYMLDESVEGLQWKVKEMLTAFNKPIIYEEEK